LTVFEDVRHRSEGFDLPDLKFRELLFIGALRRTDDRQDPARAEVEVDSTRPMPPFREQGIFPAGSRYAVARREGRAWFTRID
jgi:hypothetical protein